MNRININCLYSLCNNNTYAYIIQVEFNYVGDKMLNYVEIGSKIRAYRKIKNLSQEQLAEKVWISTTHMSHIETGTTKLSLPVLVDISNALGVGIDDLLDTEANAQKKNTANNINEVLSSCTSQQIRIIEQIVTAAKKALDENA